MYTFHFLFICFGFVTVFSQSYSDELPEFCGCNMQKRQFADYDSPGECNYFCRSRTLSYYSNHMTKEIRVFSTYDDARGIELQLCHGNRTDTTKPIILYLTSYDPIAWFIHTNDARIADTVVMEEIYVVYFRDDLGKSSVSFDNETQIIIDDSATKIKITDGDWDGYGDDEETNQILYDVKKRYNQELYSFCGGYSGNTVLCIGEYDLADHNYPNENEYEECVIPMDPFAQSMLYVGCGFFFWCCVCGSLACLQKKRQKWKERKAEERKQLEIERERERMERNKRDDDRRRAIGKQRAEIIRANLQQEQRAKTEEERVQEKNRNVYVGDDTDQTPNKRANIMRVGKVKKPPTDAERRGWKLPTYDEVNELEMTNVKRNDAVDDDIISTQPTLSYSAMSCCICLDVLLDNEATKLKCGHKFHTHCIEEYGEEHSECPLCRKEIVF